MVELLQEEVVDARDRVLERAVERLVAQVEEPSALRAEAAAERDAVRVVGRRRVERPRGWSLPVDDECLRVVIVHPAPPHVDGGVVAVDVDAAEAETSLRVGQRLQSADAPALDRLRCDLGRRGRRRAVRSSPACARARRRRCRRRPARPRARGAPRGQRTAAARARASRRSAPQRAALPRIRRISAAVVTPSRQRRGAFLGEGAQPFATATSSISRAVARRSTSERISSVSGRTSKTAMRPR